MDIIVNFIKNALIYGGGIFIAMALYLYFNQNNMLYIPTIQGLSKNITENPPLSKSPKEYNLSYEELWIKTKDNVKLYGWFIYDSKTNQKLKSTIIYFHENAGNIGIRLHQINMLIKELNVNVIIFGYRGYGPSEGSPSEQGLQIDSEAIVNFVFNEMQEKININNVYIYGRSLGGAVAVYVQNKIKSKIKGMILENTFLSIGDLVDTLFPIMSYIKNIILRNHWNTKSIIKNIEVPILFIMSEKDELVPLNHMIKLKNLAVKSVYSKGFVIKGAGHNDSFMKDKSGYIISFKEFMEYS